MTERNEPAFSHQRPGRGLSVQKQFSGWLLASLLVLAVPALAQPRPIPPPPKGTTQQQNPAQANQAQPNSVQPGAAQQNAAQQNSSQQTQQRPQQSALPSASQTALFRLDFMGTTRLRPNMDLPLVLSARQDLQLAFGAGPFSETSRNEPLQANFCLSDRQGGACRDTVRLSANRLHTYWLRLQGSPAGGSYLGALHFLPPTGDRIDHQLTLNIPDRYWRRVGTGALVLGVLLSFLLSVWLPHMRDRDLARARFLTLRSRAIALENDARSLSLSNVGGRIADVAQETAESRLASEGLIPSRVPGFGNAAQDVEKRNAALALLERKVAALEALVRATASDPTKAAALDAVAGKPDFPPADIQAAINAALASAAGRTAKGPITLTPERLVFREEIRNGAYWLIASVLTVLFGFILLIDNDPSFSGWMDVGAVFLWGLGLSTAGSRIGDLTPGQLRTALRGPAIQ